MEHAGSSSAGSGGAGVLSAAPVATLHGGAGSCGGGAESCGGGAGSGGGSASVQKVNKLSKSKRFISESEETWISNISKDDTSMQVDIIIEPNNDRRSRWVLLVLVNYPQAFFINQRHTCTPLAFFFIIIF